MYLHIANILGRILLGILSVVGSIATLGACASETPCDEPSESCACPKDGDNESALVVLVDHASPSFLAAMGRLTVEDPVALDKGRLGVDGPPTVLLTTYDEVGKLAELGSFNLAGHGDSPLRMEANARLAAACLDQAIGAVGTEGTGNLLRAMPAATALAAARGTEHAAVLAFGLGRSSLDDPTMDTDLSMAQIDLSTPQAQAHVIDVLTHNSIITTSNDVFVTLVDPDEDVDNSVSAGRITQFAQGPLCDAIAPERCQVLEVLP